ncbi:hypothetical protein EVAR_90625_1 [Eumeta japonica]|uniref:Uncharacterized protein n=1 Tax=Eumeta variegata TaxID=151549 RepID=A0A4C1ZR46_EUMVA|nr:hypothetical protein EVAR_90625_1 [Eumeta japonica]
MRKIHNTHKVTLHCETNGGRRADQNFVSELGVESVSSSAVEGGLTVAGRAHITALCRARLPSVRVSYRAANERSDPPRTPRL